MCVVETVVTNPMVDVKLAAMIFLASGDFAERPVHADRFVVRDFVADEIRWRGLAFESVHRPDQLGLHGLKRRRRHHILCEGPTNAEQHRWDDNVRKDGALDHLCPRLTHTNRILKSLRSCHAECYMGLRPTNRHESHPTLSFRAKRGICFLSSLLLAKADSSSLRSSEVTEWLDDFRRSAAKHLLFLIENKQKAHPSLRSG